MREYLQRTRTKRLFANSGAEINLKETVRRFKQAVHGTEEFECSLLARRKIKEGS